jgi:hypothetical protein
VVHKSDFSIEGNLSVLGTTTLALSAASHDSFLVESGGQLFRRAMSAGGGLLPAGTEGQTLYSNAGVWTAHSGVFWDDTNSRLGIGTTTPASTLHVNGAFQAGGAASLAATLSVTGVATLSAAGNLVRAAASASPATHFPVYILDPDTTARAVVSRTAAQVRTDIGANDAANLDTGIIPSARLSGTYGGITGVGVLASGSTGTGFGNVTTTGIFCTGIIRTDRGTQAGTPREHLFLRTTGGVQRWTIGLRGDEEADTGSTVGSDLVFSGWQNNGLVQTVQLTVHRAGGATVNGLLTTGSLTVTGATTLALSTAGHDSFVVESGGVLAKRSMAVGGGFLPTGTEGQTLYNNGGVWTAHSGVFWEDTNHRLGIGPTSGVLGKLHIRSNNVSGPSTYALYIQNASSTNLVVLSDDGRLVGPGPFELVNATLGLFQARLSADTQHRMTVGTDGLRLGPGGSTAPDVRLFRNGTNLLATASNLQLQSSILFFENTGATIPSAPGDARSTGTRMVLWPNAGGTGADYGIGIGSPGILWHSLPQNDAGMTFRWYGGNVELLRMDGTGSLLAVGPVRLIQNIRTNKGTSLGGTNHYTLGSSTNLDRFALGLLNTESTGNVGSDLTLSRYSDAGTFLGSPITVSRSTGAITLTGALAVTGAVTLSSSLTITGALSGPLTLSYTGAATNYTALVSESGLTDGRARHIIRNTFAGGSILEIRSHGPTWDQTLFGVNLGGRNLIMTPSGDLVIGTQAADTSLILGANQTQVAVLSIVDLTQALTVHGRMVLRPGVGESGLYFLDGSQAPNSLGSHFLGTSLASRLLGFWGHAGTTLTAHTWMNTTGEWGFGQGPEAGSRLTVAGSATFRQRIRLRTNSGGTSPGAWFLDASQGEGTANSHFIGTEGTGASTTLGFWGSTGVWHTRVNLSGEWGFGQAAIPGTRVSVTGSVSVTGNVTVTGTVAAATMSANLYLLPATWAPNPVITASAATFLYDRYWDQLAFQPVYDLEYYDGYAWVAWDNATAIQALFRGRPVGGVTSIAAANRQFRFTVNLGSWLMGMTFLVSQEWSGTGGTGTGGIGDLSLQVERGPSRTNATWIELLAPTSLTGTYTRAWRMPNEGLQEAADGHSPDAWYRFTLTNANAVGNEAYTCMQALVSRGTRANNDIRHSGPPIPLHWDSLRNLTAQGWLSISRFDGLQGPPTFGVNNRSAGTRLIVFGSQAGATVDYAMGMEAGSMWHSIQSIAASQFFHWYAGTTRIMSLAGDGCLLLPHTTARLGILTNDPLVQLDVRGTTRLQGGLNINHVTATPAVAGTDSRPAVVFGATDNPADWFIGMVSTTAGVEDTRATSRLGIWNWQANDWNGHFHKNRGMTVGDSTTNPPAQGLRVIGTATISGGSLSLNHPTSNWVNLSTVGVGPPAAATRSNGTKVILHASFSANTTQDYALGIESGATWMTLPGATTAAATAAQFFKWYGGAALAAQLSGGGHLTLAPATVDLPLATATGRATLYFKNGRLVVAYTVSGTQWFLTIPLDGAATAWQVSTTAP